MAITVEWNSAEQAALRLTFLGSWNWEELHRAIDVAESMGAGSASPVDLILDLTDADRLPAGSLFAPTFRAQAQRVIRRTRRFPGRVAVVGASSWFASLYGMFQGFLGRRAGNIVFSDTLPQVDDALAGSAEAA